MRCSTCETCRTRAVVGASMRRAYGADPTPSRPLLVRCITGPQTRWETMVGTLGSVLMAFRGYLLRRPVCFVCGDGMDHHAALAR